MSRKYDEYLAKHITAVQQAADWLYDCCIIDRRLDLSEHDISKYSPEEYGPYGRHFCPDEAGKEAEGEFEKAWRHHYESNPHHWEHWVKDGKATPMPLQYVVEMVCDEMAFGFIKGDLRDILNFQMEHRKEMNLHPATAILLDHYLAMIYCCAPFPYDVSIFKEKKESRNFNRFLLNDLQENIRLLQSLGEKEKVE